VARHPPAQRRWAERIAAHYGWVMKGRALGWPPRAGAAPARRGWVVDRGSALLHALAPTLLPHLPAEMPLPGPPRPLRDPAPAGRLAGHRGDGRRRRVLPELSRAHDGPAPGRAGPPRRRPWRTCCRRAGSRSSTRRARGPVLRMPFSSKAFPEAAARCASAAAEALWTASSEGRHHRRHRRLALRGHAQRAGHGALRQTGRTLRIRTSRPSGRATSCRGSTAGSGGPAAPCSTRLHAGQARRRCPTSSPSRARTRRRSSSRPARSAAASPATAASWCRS
jgi:hypothetical protein